jgi:acetate kinase
MTPVSGIMNMTRVGDIDPFVMLEIFDKNKKYFSLLDEDNYQFEKTKKEIYEESGLFALTGEKDMRDILANLKSKDKNKKDKAVFGIEVYLNRIAEKVGSAYALLGGCDELVFTGSILEKSEVIRKKLLEKLKFLELQKDFSEENIKVIKTEEEMEMVRILSENF